MGFSNKKRASAIASVASLARQRANLLKEREEALGEALRQVWLSVADADEETKAKVRETIDRLQDEAEDAADEAVIEAADAEADTGIKPVKWETVKTELGL